MGLAAGLTVPRRRVRSHPRHAGHNVPFRRSQLRAHHSLLLDINLHTGVLHFGCEPAFHKSSEAASQAGLQLGDCRDGHCTRKAGSCGKTRALMQCSQQGWSATLMAAARRAFLRTEFRPVGTPPPLAPVAAPDASGFRLPPRSPRPAPSSAVCCGPSA